MSFDLKVGFSCNNDCVHCVITDKINHGNLSTEEIFKVIRDNVSEGEDIVITGGEPTIRKDFIDILKFIYENKKGRITLQTNGRKFSDENLAMNAVKYIDFFLIAVHSQNSIIHDMITGRNGSWKQTIDGIKNLNKFKSHHNTIQSQTVISKFNINGLVKTYDFIYNELDIKKMNITFPHPMGNSWNNFDIVVPQYKDIKTELQKCFSKYGKHLFAEAIPLCYIHPYVKDVYYSDIEKKIGETSRRGFDASIGTIEDYNSMLLNDYRKGENCYSCKYNNSCIGVWKEYYEKYKHKLDLIPIKD